MPYINKKELWRIKKHWFELALEMSGGLDHSNFSESAEQLWQMALKDNGLDNDIINKAKEEEYMSVCCKNCEILAKIVKKQEQELNCYRKVLEDIEEIANVLITETNEYSKCCHKDTCGESDVSKHKKIEKTVPCPYGNVAYCQYEAVDNILTIIKELKGE